MGDRGPRIDLHAAARLLVEADLFGDDVAAKRHNVSDKTVRRYRKLQQTCPELGQLVREKAAAGIEALHGDPDGDWCKDLGPAIREQIAFLRKAAQAVDPSDPKAIYSVAGALKILADVALTSRVLDARIAGSTGTLRTEGGQVLPAHEDVPTLQ